MSQIRIVSYLPNPRLWKATIAARLNGVQVEIRGCSPRELVSWRWDYDARELSPAELADTTDVQSGTTGFAGKSLHKTAAFLLAHPFGTVPAAFGPGGATGIFESNSILRAVARLGESVCPLYGSDAYMASRIDSFLDVSLILGRETQPYLLAMNDGTLTADIHQRARLAATTYLSGIERALEPPAGFLVNGALSLADICFACELTMLWYERPRRNYLAQLQLGPVLPETFTTDYPHTAAHFRKLRQHPAFAPDLESHLATLEAGQATHER